MIEVVRSPAKVTWQVVYNGIAVDSLARKWEAKQVAQRLAKKYGVAYKG